MLKSILLPNQEHGVGFKGTLAGFDSAARAARQCGVQDVLVAGVGLSQADAEETAMTSPLPVELITLGWSVVLLLVHIVAQGATVVRERGLAWNAGPRDDGTPPKGRIAGRAQRALDNFKETYPAFVALALALVVSGRTGGMGDTGACLWLGARTVYLPLYLFGVPWLRSAAFGLSLAGLLMMLTRLL